VRSRVTDAEGRPRRWWRIEPKPWYEEGMTERFEDEVDGRPRIVWRNPTTQAFCVKTDTTFAHFTGYTIPVTIEMQGWKEIDGRPMLECEVYHDEREERSSGETPEDRGPDGGADRVRRPPG
jgi:hypothetical protein